MAHRRKAPDSRQIWPEFTSHFFALTNRCVHRTGIAGQALNPRMTTSQRWRLLWKPDLSMLAILGTLIILDVEKADGRVSLVEASCGDLGFSGMSTSTGVKLHERHGTHPKERRIHPAGHPRAKALRKRSADSARTPEAREGRRQPSSASQVLEQRMAKPKFCKCRSETESTALLWKKVIAHGEVLKRSEI